MPDRLREHLRNSKRIGAKASVARQIENWIAGYHALDGVPDEFMDADGIARSHWVRFFVTLARYNQKEIAQRFATADRLIRESGTSYRVYGETNERSWPLGRLPLLIDGAEWRTIERGIVQRAEVWDRALADIYGEGRLVADGVLPGSAVVGSTDFVRPMHGVKPPGDRWLRFYAADHRPRPGRPLVGARRPHAGAVRRRPCAREPARFHARLRRRSIAISTSIASPASSANFAPGSPPRPRASEPRICLLTPGPFSQTYYEQAYLARYLGFLLVEGDDLVVRDDKVHVRTIAGLKRADVLWRRIDAEWLDPLELNASSQLGVPGLIDAIRARRGVVANMPGAGLIESRSLLGYLPRDRRRLIGEDLILPHIATWWCGDSARGEDGARRVRRHRDLGRLHGRAARHRGRQGRRSPPKWRPTSASGCAALIERRGVDYVGQEVVRLSTTPTWRDGAIAPRPFTLRVFAAATPDGWSVMPGGFCRISDNLDARALSMGEGVHVGRRLGAGRQAGRDRRRCCRAATTCASSASSAICRAAPPTICSGSAAISNAPKRRCGWCAASARRTRRRRHGRRDRRASRAAAAAASPKRDRRRGRRRAHARRSRGDGAARATPALRSARGARASARARAASIIRERLTQEIWQILGDLDKRLDAARAVRRRRRPN